MFFNKKNKNQRKCESCGHRTDDKYSFCPYCGNSFIDFEKERTDFGLLGRNDGGKEIPFSVSGFGFFDKAMNSMLNSIMKDLDKQFKEQEKLTEREMQNTEIRSFPNGIKIKISGPIMKRPRIKKKDNGLITNQTVGEEQIKKMNSLPREKTKTNVKRLGNRVVYELLTPGVISPQDVFISKLESGYEIKALGDKKIYVTSIPVNLPLYRYSIINNKLILEFSSPEEEMQM